MKQRSFFIFVVTVFFSLFGFIGQNQTAVAQQSQGMQWALKQMDEDDDGAISRSEAKGRMLANFDRVDQDSSGNGVIDLQQRSIPCRFVDKEEASARIFQIDRGPSFSSTE